jgi:hypothetical protein
VPAASIAIAEQNWHDEMVSNPFIDERERLTSVVTTLPRELVQTNAAPLMGIVSELQASYVIEVGVIQAVIRVNVEDPQAVRQQRAILEDYLQRRLYDRDRTHCSNINRIATQLRATHTTAGTPPTLDELNQVLIPLRHADDDLLGDIEEVLQEAVQAIRAMDDSNRVDDARAEQEKFKNAMELRVNRMKNSLSRMNTLVGQLIDAM